MGEPMIENESDGWPSGREPLEDRPEGWWQTVGYQQYRKGELQGSPITVVTKGVAYTPDAPLRTDIPIFARLYWSDRSTQIVPTNVPVEVDPSKWVVVVEQILELWDFDRLWFEHQESQRKKIYEEVKVKTDDR
jgi:hypothetical protein